MSEIVWSFLRPECAPGSQDERLGLERVGQWVASRALAQALVEVAADQALPMRFIVRVGDDEVEVFALNIRRASPKEMPS